MSEFISAQYIVALQNPEPCNYTRIPNIIDHLTYNELDTETGETKVKRLSIYSKELYRVLKTAAGQENICWKNTEHLAEIANMSVGQIAKCKKELQQRFNELEGTPLIEIIEKKKSTFKNGEKLNGTVYHQIMIVNIWGKQRAYFLMKKLLKEAHSSCEPAGVADSPHEPALEGARSPHERNKITKNIKTPLFNEQHSSDESDAVCSSDKEAAIVSVDGNTEMFNWLMKIGCDAIGALKIIGNFTPEELHRASGYVQRQIEKKKAKKEPMTNIVGYLRKTLENKWWVQSA